MSPRLIYVLEAIQYLLIAYVLGWHLNHVTKLFRDILMMLAPDSFPLRIRPAPKAAQLPVPAQVEQCASQCRSANALTYVREFADGESMRQGRARVLHQVPFFALLPTQSSHSSPP